MKKLLPILPLILFFTGCAQVTYMPYEPPFSGKVGTTAAVNQKYKLPIYQGPPARPYTVIGAITASSNDFRTIDRDAVSKAIKEGADALIFFDGDEKYMGSIGFGNANITPYNSGLGVSGYGMNSAIINTSRLYAAIKWK